MRRLLGRANSSNVAKVAWLLEELHLPKVLEEIALKPGKRAYATQLWAQRRGLTLPIDAATALAADYDCDRQACAPKPGVHPAIAAWWTVRKPKPDRLDALCQNAEVLILRADVPTPPSCGGARVLRSADFAKGGAAEVFNAPGGGYRLVWAQPLRGVRPWTGSNGSGG